MAAYFEVFRRSFNPGEPLRISLIFGFGLLVALWLLGVRRFWRASCVKLAATNGLAVGFSPALSLYFMSHWDTQFSLRLRHLVVFSVASAIAFVILFVVTFTASKASAVNRDGERNRLE